MSDLPVGWAEARLADVAEVRLGRQRSPSRATGERMRPYLRAANVNWSGLALADVKEMAFTEAESKVYELQPGDILLGEASGSPAEVGKPGQYKGEIAGCCFQNTLLRVRVPKELDSDFYELFFRKEALTGRFAAGSRGVGIHHLGAAALTNWTVPVPPRAEQERIVTAIDEAFSKLDAGEAALRAARQRLKRLRESVLAAAVTGRLVPQAGLVSEGTLTSELGAPNDVAGALPATWQRSVLSEIADVRLGRQRSPERAVGPRMRPYLRAANVTWGGLSLTDVKEMSFTEAESAVHELRTGDLLLSEASGSPGEVGKPAQFRGEVTGCCIQNTLLRVRMNEACEPDFFEHFFRNEARVGNFARSSRGVGIHHLGAKALAAWVVPVPPLEEQRAIVIEIERQFSFIDACERTVDVGLVRCDALRRSILKSAFAGNLVPQDPTDKPAAALLERICAGRGAPGQVTRSRRGPKVGSSPSGTGGLPALPNSSASKAMSNSEADTPRLTIGA